MLFVMYGSSVFSSVLLSLREMRCVCMMCLCSCLSLVLELVCCLLVSMCDDVVSVFYFVSYVFWE